MELNISGVYKITNTVNQKFYIGSTVDIQKRWNHHLVFLRRGKHHNRHLQRAFVKYGECVFTIEALERTERSRTVLMSREQFYLDTLQPFKKRGYNLCRQAGSNLGVKHTAKVREAMRKRMLGRVPWNKGKKRPPFSEEWKRKLGAKPGKDNHFFGRKHSEEAKKLISEKNKGKSAGENNFFYGKDFSGEKNGMYGRTHTAEAREKIGAPQRGKKLAPEHIEALRRATSLRAAKAVEQLSLDGNVVTRHRTVGDAAIAVNTSGSYLCTLLRRDGIPTFRNYHWRYAA